jgi:hypothetical protein
MLNSGRPLERFLQRRRFAAAAPWILPPVLDIGGNTGELARYLGLGDGEYAVCNDIGNPPPGHWRTAVLLATIEHLPPFCEWGTITARRVVITTPAPEAHIVLMILAGLGLLDRENLKEHRCYFTAAGLMGLLARRLIAYRRFDLFNQLAVFE